MTHFEPLAALQDLDTKLGQLAHRRETLPERDELVQLADEMRRLDAQASDIEGERDGLRREQKRHEDEVALLEEKAAKTNDALYGGGVTSPKEAGAMQDEIASLGRRQDEIEESILELMEQIEPLESSIADLDRDRARVDAQAGSARERIAVAEAEIGAETEVVEAEREKAATLAGAELVALYDAHRASMGGRVAVGRLTGATCEACHLELSAVEVDRMRHLPPTEPSYCPECNALLVR